jgi:peptide deformylase
MPLLEIVKHPNDILRRKAQPVATVDDDIRRLLDNMVETMRAAPGVGLAGPQVAVPQRVIVVEYGEEPEEQENGKLPKKDLFTLVNPEISRSSTETEIATEGCLSIPGLVGDVERASSVTVKALNRRGQPVKIKAKGWLARIFQHEIDHINGILFIDRAIKVHAIEPEEKEETPLA